MISILYAIISSEASNSKLVMKKKQNPSSLSSYIYHPSESIKRLFGVHAKTKRSLAEEAESGDELSVRSWIRSGANPNEYDAYGYTPLLNAAANGRLEAVKNLIKNGASINMTGPYNYTALLAASQYGHNEIVLFLLENGADINVQNEDKDTALHLALRENHIEVVNELLRHGISTKIIGYNQKSSAQYARKLGLNDLAIALEN